jgi:hypothetical protein
LLFADIEKPGFMGDAGNQRITDFNSRDVGALEF